MQRGALWRNTNFVNLWGAAAVSTFGSLVTRTALPFTAILVLDASPSAIGVLRVAELLPGFVFGLIAGAWVDRLRRKPIMIATDLGRALLIATVPVAAFLGLARARASLRRRGAGQRPQRLLRRRLSVAPPLARRKRRIGRSQQQAQRGDVSSRGERVQMTDPTAECPSSNAGRWVDVHRLGGSRRSHRGP